MTTAAGPVRRLSAEEAGDTETSEIEKRRKARDSRDQHTHLGKADEHEEEEVEACVRGDWADGFHRHGPERLRSR